MFPTVRCSFTNLKSDQKYWVLIDIIPCDNKRYRYAYHRSSWLVAGKADPPPPHRLYAHPDAPYSGDQLRKQVVSFEKVKLTNNEMDKNGQVTNSHIRKFSIKHMRIPFRLLVISNKLDKIFLSVSFVLKGLDWFMFAVVLLTCKAISWRISFTLRPHVLCKMQFNKKFNCLTDIIVSSIIFLILRTILFVWGLTEICWV